MEKEILTPGQKAVIDGFLKKLEPTDNYNPETCMLYDTQTIVDELSPMCDFDKNILADYLASIGCRYHIIPDDDALAGLSGWILKKIAKH